MTQPLPEFAAQRLKHIERANRYRVRREYAARQGMAVACDDADLTLFCSNDYLGLSDHPRLVEALSQAAERYGVGSTASQYINGHSAEIAAFERELAAFLDYPRVLLLGSGYLVNTGVIDALVGRDDVIVSDALNHASLIDGCRLSGARVERFAHADIEAADQALAACVGDGQRLLLSDAVFSMDGDIADIPALARLARQRSAWLMLDDAHGVGVLGPQGRGAVALHQCGVSEVPVLTGTLGKAFGVYGAFVAASNEVIDCLTQVTRTGIFATALPPPLVASLRAALELVADADQRRAHLNGLIEQFRAGLVRLGLPDTASSTPIQPLIVGPEDRALALSEALRARGLWVTAIRPPTVPAGTCRLRITLSAAHSEADVQRLLAALDEIMPRD